MSPLRFVTLLISVVMVAWSPRASVAGLFRTARTYPSGEGVVAAAVQDFNHDGFADIVTANLTDKNVNVFLNNGNGTFGSANNFPVGVGAIEVASGDLDGDGNADLVVTDASTSAHVALGNGDGTFGAFSTITLHSQPKGIAIADLNADGIPDLAIAIFGPAHTFDGEVAVLIGNGDGSFASPVFYELGSQQGNRVVAIDLNNDGKLDLAVAIQHGERPANGLAVLLGNGDGTFQSAVTSVAEVNATDVAAADLNGDGKMDLALAGTSTVGVVEVVLGNGDGTFQSATPYSTAGTGSNTLNVADVNRDGFADLVVGGDQTAIFVGDGSGGFGPATIYGIGQGFARIGYFNHDQIPDIIGNGQTTPASIAVAFGRADGAINAPRLYRMFQFGYAGYVNGFDAADFDGDGQADLVIGGTIGQILFLHGVGDGTFAEPIPFASLTAGSVIAADFNGDGKEDVLDVPTDGNLIHTILGNGDGSFQDPLATSVPADLEDSGAVVGDFNHDGKTDVALTSFFDSTLTILLGNGDGTFQPAIAYQTPNGPQEPTVADFNLDGNLDLALSHAFISEVTIYLGHGDGTFDSPLKVASRGALYLAAGDLNLDGKPDLAVGGGGALHVYLGNGDGTFGPGKNVYSNYGPVQIADIDLDGRPDIMVSNFGSALAGLRGQGDGTFRPAVEFPTGSVFTGNLVLKDLNGDQRPEVIVDDIGDTLTVLLNASRHR